MGLVVRGLDFDHGSGVRQPGNDYCEAPLRRASTEAPTIWLIADPQSRTSNEPGVGGGPEVSQDSVSYADGGIQPCSCVVSSPPGAVYSNVNQSLVEGAFGYGRPDKTTPQIIGNGMLVQVINVPDPTTTTCPTNTPVFVEPDFHYAPLYGTGYTLTETQVGGQNKLLLTAPDGTVWQFADPSGDGQGYATGLWEKTVLASGQTTTATWTSTAMGERLAEVNQFASPSATEPSEVDVYDYIASGPNAGLCDSITYLYWNSAANDGAGGLIYGKQITYTYYGTNDSNGLPGDLQTITTQYAVGATLQNGTPTWTGDDTYYFRYYVDADGGKGFAHGLRNELLPNAYSSLAAAEDPNGTPAEQLSVISGLADSVVDNYTCFYYEYDQSHRVTKETVFGALRTEPVAYTEGADSQTDTNAWSRKTVETFQDGSTDTVYTNYLGQTILDDLANASGSDHTYTYYEYDAYGNQTLKASSSTIAGYWDGQEATPIGAYDGSTSVNDYHIHLTLSTTGGPVEEDAYQYVAVSEFNMPTGLLQSKSIADGLAYPGTGSNSYSNPNSVLQESYTYAPETVYTDGVPVTTYPVATDTTYTTATSTLSSTDALATPTTSKAYTYYPGTSQEETVVTTLPVVSTSQNGSGVAAQTVDFYDQQGNLVWSKDARGFLTHNIYDPFDRPPRGERRRRPNLRSDWPSHRSDHRSGDCHAQRRRAKPRHRLQLRHAGPR